MSNQHSRRRPKRANGEGSVTKLADGRWLARRLVLRPDGTYTRLKAEAKTRAQAVARLAVKVAAVEAGATSAKPPLLREYLATWYSDTFAPNADPGSTRTYRSLIDHQIVPYLGARRLDELAIPRLASPKFRTWLADLGRAGLSPKTISMARSVLRQALDQAVEDGVIAHHALTRRIKGPPVPKSAGKPLSVEQARQVLDAARGERLELGIRLALGLGLRSAEVCGLRRDNIDLDGGWLTVAGQACYTPGRGVWWKPKLKTAGSRRKLKLPAVLVGAIRWHGERQKGERAVMGWEPTEYVFTSSKTGELLNPDTLYQNWRRIATAAGLEGFRLHDLRHSAATFLLAEGVSIKKVQQVLGHSRAATTLDVYGHLLPGDDNDATDRIARLLAPPPPPPADDDAQEAAG